MGQNSGSYTCSDGEIRALLVGVGFAGRRFLSVLQHLKETKYPQLNLAVCDPQSERMRGVSPDIISFDSLETALREFNPAVVSVCVNEFAHYDVLKRILRRDTSKAAVSAVLCEKPLTETLAQAEKLCGFENRGLSVNLIERFSPVCAKLRSWLSNHPQWRVARVESHWGKCRISDPRPTMGVLSEIIHPLDLIDHLFCCEELVVCHAFGVESDLGVDQRPCLDSVVLLAETPTYPVVVHSSFAWATRQRTVTALLVDQFGDRCTAHLEFDNPKWDCDRLVISRVRDSDAQVKDVLLDYSVSNNDFPAGLEGLFKMKEFIETSLRVFVMGEAPDPRLVDYSQILKMQRWMDALQKTLEAHGSIYSAPIALRGAQDQPTAEKRVVGSSW